MEVYTVPDFRLFLGVVVSLTKCQKPYPYSLHSCVLGCPWKLVTSLQVDL